MKMKINRWLLVILLLVLGNQAKATPSPSVSAKTINSKVFSLYVKTLDDNSNVEIKDEEGKVIFKEVLKKGYIYRKTYDISGLAVGTYYVEVKDKESTKIFSIIRDEIKLVIDEKNIPEPKKE
ncbi:hypothetical protein [Flavicella sediminum]|uniref:hypothetical protein n=1 Tax=Flavicella sediminum TaxID=2585141 RepID=UPI00111F18D4|nr:hypothetical protein [Flavicella sediminum]